MSRNLPDDLIIQLRRARRLEASAEGLDQSQRAVAATATLMLAAVERGWLIADIAHVMDLRPSTASKRVRDARARHGDHVRGLIVDTPAILRGPLAELQTPVEERAWLTRAEAADHLDVAPRTIQDYWTDGLLPNSRKVTGTRRVYLRADLDRVRNGPRRGVYLDRAALRRRIRAR